LTAWAISPTIPYASRFGRLASLNLNPGEGIMWHKPKITEICVGAEINSYVSAARK
jgi:coenzyme PQQ precursor peptide PqqA